MGAIEPVADELGRLLDWPAERRAKGITYARWIALNRPDLTTIAA